MSLLRLMRLYFSMQRKHEITGDVFDILLSCGDFCEFKFLMLSHKFSKQNGAHLVLSAGT